MFLHVRIRLLTIVKLYRLERFPEAIKIYKELLSSADVGAVPVPFDSHATG